MIKQSMVAMMRAFNALVPMSWAGKLRRFHTLRYTVWVSRTFGAMGAEPNICKPIQLKGAHYIFVGDYFGAGYRNRIEAWDEYRGELFTPQIVIGNNVCLNNDCHIGAINRIVIGDNVLIGSRVLITDHNHGSTQPKQMHLPPALRPLVSSGAVEIRRNVWIGEGAAILGGVTIGENAIVAANSVVTRSVPANCVVAGVPARRIKEITI